MHPYDNQDRVERQAWEAVGLPADDPIAFDYDRWTVETFPRAVATAHKPTRRLGTLSPWAFAAALLLAALIAIPYHPFMQQPAKPHAPLSWSGTGPLVVFHMVSPTVGWAMPQMGSVILRTTGGPAHFHPVSHFPIASANGMWNSYYFGTKEMLIALARSGTRQIVVARTLNGGRTWTDHHWLIPPSHGTVLSVQVAWRNRQDGTALVQSGNARGPDQVQASWLYTTTDNGAHWRLVSSSVHGTLPPNAAGVSVSGKEHVWIGAGLKGTTMFVSKDGGRTFVPASLPGTSPGGTTVPVRFFPSVHFFGTGSLGVWLTRSQGQSSLYETQDSGRTWASLRTYPRPKNPSLTFLNTRQWWVADASIFQFGGGSGALWSTENSGATWIALGTPTIFAQLLKEKNSLISFQFVSATIGYATWETRNAHETITVTTDGGRTWRILKTLSKTSHRMSGSGP